MWICVDFLFLCVAATDSTNFPLGINKVYIYLSIIGGLFPPPTLTCFMTLVALQLMFQACGFGGVGLALSPAAQLSCWKILLNSNRSFTHAEIKMFSMTSCGRKCISQRIPILLYYYDPEVVKPTHRVFEVESKKHNT